MDIHIMISLIFTGTRCLDNLRRSLPDLEIESLRQTLVLCAAGLYSQRNNNFLAQALYSKFLSAMRVQEIALLKQVSDLVDDEQTLSLRQATLSSWIPVVVGSRDDLDYISLHETGPS
jgi:hypothetical protein